VYQVGAEMLWLCVGPGAAKRRCPAAQNGKGGAMSVIEDAPAVQDNDTTANNSNHAPSGQNSAAKSTIPTRLLVTSVALAAAMFHLIWSDLKVDGVIVALLVVALVPWLGAVFDSIELPGGLKVHYLVQQLNEAQTELSKAQTETRHAKRAAASASEKAAVAFAKNKPDSRTRHADKQLRDLVARYSKERAAQESSPKRTAILTDIAGKMIALSGQLPHYHWRRALKSDDPGLRVAGYAWLYANPTPRAAQLLVDTVTVCEETHFGQYWGLEALQRCLPLADPVTVAELTPRRKEFLAKLPTDSDRHYGLSSLLERLAEPSQS
jgi:hypothetical protein